MQRVPSGVIAGFGLERPSPAAPWGIELGGGRGPAFRFGDVVVKPVVEEVEARVIAEVIAGLDVDQRQVRVARPVVARDGDWVVDGWSAWEWLDGSLVRRPHDLHHQALAAIDAFHAALCGVPWSRGLAPDRHRWAVADRAAWGELDVELDPRLEVLANRLGECTVEAGPGPLQLVHGDIWGNLLFHPELKPGLIDFSPFWRSVSYAKAIYVFDSMAWGGAGDDLLDLVGADQAVRACLPRAARFRVVALDGIRRERRADIEPHLPAFEAVTARVVSLAIAGTHSA